MTAATVFLSGAEQLPTLSTPRLRLRAVGPEDVGALFAIFGDPDVCRYWSRPPLVSEDEAAALQREIAEHFSRRTLFQWAVVEQMSDTVVGTGTLAALSAEHRRAEIGFALRRASWGRGYLREVLPALLTFAFEGLGLHRVEADVDPRNARSIRVLEREGFRREGYLRERYYMGGEVQDALLYGLLRREWVSRGLK